MRKILLFIVCAVMALSAVQAQFSALPANLSSYKSADVSDLQLAQIATQMKQNNVDENQAYDLLVQRGMSVAEALLLKNRLQVALQQQSGTPSGNGMGTSVDPPSTTTNNSKSRVPLIVNETTPVKNPNKIFGAEIFNNGVISLEPNVKITPPASYIIGPDDELTIQIYGYQEAKMNLTVSPDGDITVPNAGVLYVAGLTLAQANAKIKNKLAVSGYSNLNSGLTKLKVSIGRIRTIKVAIIGEVKTPGTYTLSSLSTVFNALYLSGGPNTIGSMRLIEVVRHGKVIETLDIYDFLIKGDQRSNIYLQDQDVIRIPAYQKRISVTGEVKREGLYEVIAGEHLATLLQYAGGFTDSAYTAAVKVFTTSDSSKRIVDVAQAQFATYFPGRAEQVVVRKLVDRYSNMVTINGAVFLPGDYELTDGMTVKQLIIKAMGLKEDAYKGRGLIHRLKADLSKEILAFSPAKIMDNTDADILLHKNDQVEILANTDLKEQPKVIISGEVRSPGEYVYSVNMSVKDLVFMANGFTDAAAPQKIEVARRVKKDKYELGDVQLADVIEVNSVEDLMAKGGEIKLQPWDLVEIRRSPGYIPQQQITVSGEVAYPGMYVIQSKTERISDLIKRAGGLTPQAYSEGVYVTRLNKQSITDKVNQQKIQKIQRSAKNSSTSSDSLINIEVQRASDQIAINLQKVLSNPGSNDDLILEEGDILTVLREKKEVSISGEVLFPTQVVFEEGRKLDFYLSRAGGVTPKAVKRRIYVLKPNGNAVKTSKFLFFRNYPTVTPGSQIIVPGKPDNSSKRMSTGEVIGISTAIASMGGVLVALLNILK
jgi:protein involved in polysaccharide export with SLBB domain